MRHPMGAASASATAGGHLKDAVLAELADSYNVAQFVSFGPGKEPGVRYIFVRDLETSDRLGTDDLIAAQLARTAEGSVNVRSFLPDQPKSNEFIYGLTRTADVISAVERLASNGYYTIVNETIDVSDGGVSGVSFGGV